MKLLKSWRIAADRVFAELFGGLIANAAQWEPLTTVTYGVAPAINAALGNLFVVTATDGVAFVFAAPTNPPATGFAQTIFLTIRNAAGAPHGAITFNAVFLIAATAIAIADTKSRTFCFRWNGTNWVELWRGAADVAN